MVEYTYLMASMTWCAVVRRLSRYYRIPPSQSSLGEAGKHPHHVIGQGWSLEWSSLDKGTVRRRVRLGLLVVATSSSSLTAGAGDHIVVPGNWCWWQSSSQSDDTGVVVDVIDAELSRSFVMVGTAPWWSPLDKTGSGIVAVAVG